MKELAGKVAFITGGGSGIGRGMANAFASAGMKVAIADVRADRLERVEAELRQITQHVVTIETNVTDADALKEAAEKTENEFGNVHVVCNNAGIGVGGPVVQAPMSNWRRVVDVNLWGVINGCHVFAPRIVKHGEGGHIVNTASIMGLYTSAGSGPYCATKFAVVGMSECMQKELAASAIGVSVLCPFIVDTPIFYPDLDDLDSDGIEARKKQLPLMQFALQPVRVGEIVLQAIRENEFYIFTDGVESRRMIGQRMDAMQEAMNRQHPKSENVS